MKRECGTSNIVVEVCDANGVPCGTSNIVAGPKDLVLQQDSNSDCHLTSNKILSQVLGKRSGYARGKKYGMHPMKKRTQSQSFEMEKIQQHMKADFDRRLQQKCEQLEQRFSPRIQDEVAAIMASFQSGQPRAQTPAPNPTPTNDVCSSVASS